MLPAGQRLTRKFDFARTLKKGVRVSRPAIVVSVDFPDLLVSTGGPRFGLIVGKSVGNAVARHALSRRLRAACADLITELPTSAFVVIRALPGSANFSKYELQQQLSYVFSHRGVVSKAEGRKTLDSSGAQ